MDEDRIYEKAGEAANELKNGITSVSGTIGDLAGQTRSAVAQASETLKHSAVEAGRQVGDAAKEVYRQGARAGEYVSRNTAEQPLLALLVAGAVGYALAYLIHGPDSRPPSQ
jgi:hypothetical protein